MVTLQLCSQHRHRGKEFNLVNLLFSYLTWGLTQGSQGFMRFCRRTRMPLRKWHQQITRPQLPLKSGCPRAYQEWKEHRLPLCFSGTLPPKPLNSVKKKKTLCFLLLLSQIWENLPSRLLVLANWNKPFSTSKHLSQWLVYCTNHRQK